MSSRIMDTLNDFLREENSGLSESEHYIKISKDLEYFENYVTDNSLPDVVGMINQSIIGQVKHMKNPALSLFSKYPDDTLASEYKQLALSSHGTTSGELIIVGHTLNAGIEVANMTNNDSNIQEDHSKPSFSINRLGYNRIDRHKLIDKGVKIDMYNIPKDLAQIIIKDFKKIESEERNVVLIMLAMLEDDIEWYSDNNSVNFVKEQIKNYGTTQEGIDENNAYFYGRLRPIIAYGAAHGFHHLPYMSIDMRIERIGEIYKLPNDRNDW